MPSVELIQESVKKKQDFRQLCFKLLRKPGVFRYFDEKSKQGIYILNMDSDLVNSLFPKFKEAITVVIGLHRNELVVKKVI